MINYKHLIKKKAVYHLSNEISFDYNEILKKISIFFYTANNTCQATDLPKISTFLSEAIYVLQKYENQITEPVFFQFLVKLFKTYDKQEIFEKIIILSTYISFKDVNEVNIEIIQQILLLLLPLMKDYSFAIIPYLKSLSNKLFYSFIESSGVIENVIDIINYKMAHSIFSDDDSLFFDFLSLAVKYIGVFNQSLLTIALQNYQCFYGIELISYLVAKNYINLNDLYNIIQYHLENINKFCLPGLFRMLKFLAYQNSDFFANTTFFQQFYKVYDFCLDDKMKAKYIKILYLLAPFYSNHLMPFISQLLSSASEQSYIVLHNVFDLLLLFLQEANEEIVNNFICIETFDIFEKLLLIEDSRVSIKLTEIIIVLQDINPSLFQQVLNQTSIFDILQKLQSSEDEYVSISATTAIQRIIEEEEDYE